MSELRTSSIFRIIVFASALTISSAAFAQEPPPSPPPETPPVSPQTPPPTEPQPPKVEPQPPATPPPPSETPIDQTNPSVPPPPAQPSILSQAAGTSYDRRESFPNVNLYLPEGQASIRDRKSTRLNSSHTVI